MSSHGNSYQRLNSALPEWWQDRQWRLTVHQVLNESRRLQAVSDQELRRRATDCRLKVRLTKRMTEEIVEVFALVREISVRAHGLHFHPVQILAATAMAHGWIAEMRTGEGKTLTSLMTIAFLALQGKECHVFTANQYLASRDCDFARPVLSWFGLTAAALHDELNEPSRRTAYEADVTYGTESAFGFDFLKDRLFAAERLEQAADFPPAEKAFPLQRGQPCAVIDEADSILIDQASVPLIISCPQRQSAEDLELLHWSGQIAGRLTAGLEFSLNPRDQLARLTNSGCRKVRLIPKPVPLLRLPSETIFTQIERALAARHYFREQREYVVIDCRLEIIDQGTGRILPGRKWRDGLQQAIEVQAGLQPSDTAGTAARITLQSYLQRYQFVCGMTGTAAEARREFRQVYGLRVTSIPTHFPCRLRQLPPRVFSNKARKWSAILAEAERLTTAGRAVLIVTSSIQATDECAARLREKDLDVQTLHAQHHKKEAEIIRQAGLPGQVTVSTNMAGRGTDIRLHDNVRSAGGLHVILSEMNRSDRIDRQLAGRAGRQGDPGSAQMFASLEDELLQELGPRPLARLLHRARRLVGDELPSNWIAFFEDAQRKNERRSVQARRQLMHRERRQRKLAKPLGLDPYVEFPLDW